MLRTWRRKMERRLENETGRITVEKGLMATAVVGSAISLLLYTGNIKETKEQNNTAFVEPIQITTEETVGVSPQLPEMEMPTQGIPSENNIMEKFKPLMVEEAVNDSTPQSEVANGIAVLDEVGEIFVEEIKEIEEVRSVTAEEPEIIVAAEQIVYSEEGDPPRAEMFAASNNTPASSIEGKATEQSMSQPVVTKEQIIPPKKLESDRKTGNDSVEKVNSSPALVARKPVREVEMAKADIVRNTNTTTTTTTTGSPLTVSKEKLIKNNEKSNTSMVAVQVKGNVNEDASVLATDKVVNVPVEMALGTALPLAEEIGTNQQVRDENKIVVLEVAAADLRDEGAQIVAVGVGESQEEVRMTPEVMVTETIQVEGIQIPSNQQVVADQLLVEEFLTNDTVILQNVNSAPYMYRIRDTSDGITSMTMAPKMGLPAFSGILSSTDLSVFQVKNGEISYNGSYYTENSKNGLTMAQIIGENIQKPSSDSKKVQGTYMTMDWKDNPSSDFFIGFNGSALVVYPLDEEAKVVISATDAVNNRPIVVASIMEALGHMKINLAQIESVSIYAE